MGVGNKVKDHTGREFNSVVAMCKHWKVARTTFMGRLEKGYSLEQALTGKNVISNTRKCKDHTGREFNSVIEMLNYYNIKDTTFFGRQKLGYTLEQCLTGVGVPDASVKCQDHLGNTFESIKDMCKAYNVNLSAYNGRINLGHTVEEALTGKNIREARNMCQDHLGNIFSSESEMCDAYNVRLVTYLRRKAKGHTIEQCLGLADIAIKTGNNAGIVSVDHKGNTFRSKREMCRYWGIEHSCYDNRILSGMTVEQALTTPIKNTRCKDHLGNKYMSEAEMCRHYNIPVSTYKFRRENGMSLAEALTSENKALKIKYKDHLGIGYASKKEMCENYGITIKVFNHRIAKGYSIEQALTYFDDKKDIKLRTDPNGVVHNTVHSMCNAWGIPFTTYTSRISRGYTMLQSLTGQGVRNNSIRCKDHLGREYASIKEMCDAWRIDTGTFFYRIRTGMSLEEALTKEVRR